MRALFSTSPTLQRTGPTVKVEITPSSALIRTLTKPEEIEKYSKRFSGTFLIDTGASCSLIDKGVAPFLGLVKHGDTKMLSPGGDKDCETYDVDFNFGTPIPHTVPNIQAMEASLKERQGIDGIIGRDILKKAILIYQGGSNQYTLAF